MRDFIVFGGVNSLDYDTWAANVNQFDAAQKSVETVKVPGRNGTLSISDGSYENITVTYSLYSKGDIKRNVDAFKAAINAVDGYAKLVDTFSPDHYRLARYTQAFAVDSSDHRNAGFMVEFDCDPRKFLKAGQNVKAFTASGVVKNQTLFDALPLLRVYGTGTVTVGSVAVTINTADGYTDIDCEMQEAYRETDEGIENCNNNVTLSSGEFPKLSPGNNNIYLSGVSKVEITPRYWTI